MEYPQLHLGVHSQVGDYHNQRRLYGSLGGVTLHVHNRNHLRESTSYLQLYLGGHIQISACDDQLLGITTCGIIWS